MLALGAPTTMVPPSMATEAPNGPPPLRPSLMMAYAQGSGPGKSFWSSVLLPVVELEMSNTYAAPIFGSSGHDEPYPSIAPTTTIPLEIATLAPKPIVELSEGVSSAIKVWFSRA